jgi:hypothetical protein
MPRESLEALPDDSRAWVFGVERPLSEDEEARFLRAIDEFLNDWKAHGVPLRTARDWRRGRFLIVAVDQRSEPPSGCSIDALVRVLKHVGDSLGVATVDNTPVWHLDRAGEVQRSSRSRFRQLVEEGNVTGDTIVFDNSVTQLGHIRSGRWETTAARSWHARAFRLEKESRTAPTG